MTLPILLAVDLSDLATSFAVAGTTAGVAWAWLDPRSTTPRELALNIGLWGGAGASVGTAFAGLMYLVLRLVGVE